MRHPPCSNLGRHFRDEYPMWELHLYRKRSLDLEQCSIVIARKANDTGRDFTWQLFWSREDSTPRDIAREILTRRFMPEPRALFFLVRWCLVSFDHDRKSPASEKSPLSFAGFQEEETRGGGGPQRQDVVRSPQKSDRQIMLDVTSCSLLPAAATAISSGRTAWLFVYCAARNSIKPREPRGRVRPSVRFKDK